MDSIAPNCLAFSPDGTTLAAGMAIARGGNPAVESRRRHLARALQEPEEHPRVRTWPFRPTERSWPRSGGEARWYSLTPRPGRSWTRCRAFVWRTARWRFHPMEGRSRPPETDRPSLLGPGDGQGPTGHSRSPPGRRGGPRVPRRRQDARLRQRDRTVRIWDLATGRPTKMLPHDGWVRSLAVSADGSLLAAGLTYPDRGKVQRLESQDRRAASCLAGRG